MAFYTAIFQIIFSSNFMFFAYLQNFYTQARDWWCGQNGTIR